MKTILFDLDGTIVDSGVGVTTCAQYALKHFGIEEPDITKLRFFIGPPLTYSFMEHYGFSKEQAEEAIEKYRERYHKTGIFECELYPGIKEVLKRLKEKQFTIALASSKPEPSCLRILEHFGIAEYFDEVVGAEMHGPRNEKKDVLIEALKRLQKEPQECVLIGDTRFDANGAKEVGMDCIGITYGYGTKEELLNAGAIAVFDRIEEVEQYLEEQ